MQKTVPTGDFPLPSESKSSKTPEEKSQTRIEEGSTKFTLQSSYQLFCDKIGPLSRQHHHHKGLYQKRRNSGIGYKAEEDESKHSQTTIMSNFQSANAAIIAKKVMSVHL